MCSPAPRKTVPPLIGRLSQRNDARWLAELLIDIEGDEIARLQLADGLRRVLRA